MGTDPANYFHLVGRSLRPSSVNTTNTSHSSSSSLRLLLLLMPVDTLRSWNRPGALLHTVKRQRYLRPPTDTEQTANSYSSPPQQRGLARKSQCLRSARSSIKNKNKNNKMGARPEVSVLIAFPALLSWALSVSLISPIRLYWFPLDLFIFLIFSFCNNFEIIAVSTAVATAQPLV